MSYGLKIKGADGVAMLDTTDKITRLMYVSSQTASAGNSGALSKLAGLNSAQFAIPVNGSVTVAPHTVTRTGTTISWTTNSFTYVTPATCIVFCFAYT